MKFAFCFLTRFCAKEERRVGKGEKEIDKTICAADSLLRLAGMNFGKKKPALEKAGGKNCYLGETGCLY